MSGMLRRRYVNSMASTTNSDALSSVAFPLQSCLQGFSSPVRLGHQIVDPQIPKVDYSSFCRDQGGASIELWWVEGRKEGNSLNICVCPKFICCNLTSNVAPLGGDEVMRVEPS